MARTLAVETTSLADAKNRLSELVAAVEGTWERILITKNGKPAAVLIAPDDLESLLETLDVLTDAETMAAIKEAEDPATRMYTLQEVEAAMEERRSVTEPHDVRTSIGACRAQGPLVPAP